MKTLSLKLTIKSISLAILGALAAASNAHAFPASTVTPSAETSAFAEEDGVKIVGNDLCIDIPITLLECRHTYGDPAVTEITKHALRAGLTKEQVKAAGVDKCFNAGVRIRERLDREAGGKGKSKAKYPKIDNVIGGYEPGRLKLCIPLPFSWLIGGSSEPTDSADAETVSSTFGSLAGGALEPSELTEAQIEELRALAESEDFTSTGFIEINEPVASN